MIRFIIILLLCICPMQLLSQEGQLSIARIDRMPDSPNPLLGGDWKQITRDYDQFVFDQGKTGQYLPLSRLGAAGQYNYPDNRPLFLDSYVGADSHLNQAEAINIMPAIVGATLIGIDKSSQNKMNWVAATKDFFNLKNRQNVYLNGYSTTSGGDWWYDLMPNVYFYQLRSLYPGLVPEFEVQFAAVADSWLQCVESLGGNIGPWTPPNMNFRAFNLITQLPLATGVVEPESAGSIAWILYHAYCETGKEKYFQGAQLAMDFLTSLSSNPSYELQLPYGTLAAAKMNAIEGTNYPVGKMLDWCFNRGDLRGWGSIIGTWGGFDVSGLIGEANDGGDDYAFVMNGFQQAAALAPLPKYDKRYARAIAKWLLNLSNASHLFYADALPETNQDSWSWSTANDPERCIPYESMKQSWLGKIPFATGDAVRGGWAATNLSLYSGSSVGYLAAVVGNTDIPEILQIDLNKTDFYGDNRLGSYLYFNPATVAHTINITLPPGTFGVYEALTETILFSEAESSINLTIPAGEVRLIRIFESASGVEERDGKLYSGNYIIDYQYHYNFDTSLRIKALTTDRDPILKNTLFTAYCEPGNIHTGETIQYEWYLDEVRLPDLVQKQVQIMAPGNPSRPVLKCRISNGSRYAEDTIRLNIAERIPLPPIVTGITAESKFTVSGGTNTFTAQVESGEGETLVFSWTATSGGLNQNFDNPVTWQAPSAALVSTITVTVTNQDQLSTTVSVPALVKDTTLADVTPIIWYPFDSNDRNVISDRFHATVEGATKTTDARGLPSLAYQFTSGGNIIYTDNQDELNFSEAVSLSCWVKCDQLGSERFIVSHGSWQQRYKLSITPEGHLRWTIKTGTGVADLDTGSPIEINRFYHVCALYTGYSMEIYLDGILNNYSAFSGSILPSTKSLTIGRMDQVETQYALRGAVDEVKIWSREISLRQIEGLKNLWMLEVVEDTLADPISRIWPNPARDVLNIEFSGKVDLETLRIFSSDGRLVSEFPPETNISAKTIEIPKVFTGVYLLRITLKDGRQSLRKVVIRNPGE